MKQMSSSQNQASKNEKQLKKREWLKQTLHGIQDHIADEASTILQKRSRQASKLENKQAETKQVNLDILNQQELMMRRKLVQINGMKKSGSNQKPRTYDNYKNVMRNNQQLKELTRKYRAFKQNLEEKSRKIKDNEQRDKQKLIKLREQHLKTLCQKRKNKIEKAIQKIQTRKIKREQELKLQKAKLKQLKKERLYERMVRSFNKKMNDSIDEKIRSFQKSKRFRVVDMSSLSQHEKNYQILKQDRQQRRTVKLAESRLLPQLKLYRSRFTNRVLEEQKQLKQIARAKLQYARQIKKKHNEYQQRVREDFLPTRIHRDQIYEKQNKITPLEFNEAKKKGNQYYKMGQKYAIPLQKREQHQKNKQLQESLERNEKKYPNYLTVVLKNISNHKKTLNYKSQLSRIKKTIQDDKLSKKDKFQQIRTLIQTMSYTFEPNKQFTEEQLVNRLNIKMELLSMLENYKQF